MKFTEELLKEMHRKSTANMSTMDSSGQCACFHCLERYPFSEILEVVDDRDGLTAVCPKCDIDSVLPDVPQDLLEAMHEYWFGRAKPLQLNAGTKSC